MNNLLLHDRTQIAIETFIAKPFHFLIISGPPGAGKTKVAKEISASILNLDSSDKLALFPAFFHLLKPADKREIVLEDVRNLISELRLKTAGKKELRRIMLIEDAHFLSEDAQNILLKTLEEPPADTLIILTVDSLNNLLPTIASRANKIEVLPVDKGAAETYFQNRDINQSWALSEGYAGLMKALLEGDEGHEVKQSVEEAKNFLRMSSYECMRASEFSNKNRQQMELFIEGLKRVVKALHKRMADNQSGSVNRGLIDARILLDETQKALNANVSTKLLYLRLARKLRF